MRKNSTPQTGIAEAIATDSAALDEVATKVRESLVQAIRDRAEQLGEDSWQAEALVRGLRSLLGRLDQVHALSRAFLIQTHPDHAPCREDGTLALEELVGAIETLFAIEVEARAAQARLAQSASVLEYAGVVRSTPRVMTFRVDQHVADRFKRLGARVRHERIAAVGHSPALPPEELLNLLLSLGECNTPTLALMGCASHGHLREVVGLEAR